jgi:diaminopropionate ammonia-lyase
MYVTTEYSHFLNKTRLDEYKEIVTAICVQNLSRWTEAIAEISTWPEYEPQPLHSLPHRAEQLWIGKLFFKDESKRFGASLGSLKALDAAYALFKILAEEVFSKTGVGPTSEEL